ncbi:MAG: two-component regulator propeller domain-containing protein, partial [Gemmatimonadales bacterium]
MRRAAGCVLALTGLAGVAQAQLLNFRNYTGREGLPQAQVLSLYQDRAGFLWIGTYGGLTRFDGADFQTHTRREGLSSNAVTAIAEDDRGRLVVGTYGGGVCYRQDASFQCLGEAEGLPSADVTMVVRDGQGGLWIATEGGAAHAKDGRLRAFTMADGLPSPHVTRIAIDDSGRVWAGTSTGLARLDDGRWRVVDDAPELASAPISVLLPTPAGLVVGTTDAIYRLHRGTVRTLPAPDAETGAPTGAAIDLVGQLWIATRSGAIRYRGDTASVFTMDAGLVDDNLNGVLVDREGSVWFGTESGLAKLTPGPFSHFTTREGLPNPFVRALAEDQDGRLWAGTRGGLAIREGSGFRTIDFDGAPHDWVYDLAPAPGGGMLIATREGLVWYAGGVKRVYQVADGLPDDFVVALLPDARGGVWVGTAAGLARWDGGRIEPLPDGEQTGFVTALAFDARGRLLVGRRGGGIMVRDGAFVETLSQANGLTDQSIWAIARDSAGSVWVGTNGDGVFQIARDGTLHQFTTASGLVNDHVWQVLPDRRGRVWLFTNHGLDRLEAGTIRHFGTGDGLFDLEGNASASIEDRDGVLWFGTGSGVTRYAGEESWSPLSPPAVRIETATVGTDTLGLDGAVFAAAHGLLRVRYTAPSFRNPEAILFRHRLEGVDTTWSEPVTERTVQFARLEAGSYVLEVAAAVGRDGPLGTPARLVFTVRPTWWQTLWFKGLLLLALSEVHATITWLWARRLRRAIAQLERVVSS